MEYVLYADIDNYNNLLVHSVQLCFAGLMNTLYITYFAK